jgi:hypothetical protein
MFLATRLQKITALCLGIAAIAAALSRTCLADEKGVRLAVSGMALFNSSEQGGQGPSGSTILTQSDLIYSGRWWSLGGFFGFDKQGSNETDTSLGPKLELHYLGFYVESGWAPYMHRAFTDRSIAQQTGSAWLFGAGVRVPLASSRSASSRGGGGGGPFLQFSYKYRIQNLDQQDGVKLSDTITQRDGYPLFGIGYKF